MKLRTNALLWGSLIGLMACDNPYIEPREGEETPPAKRRTKPTKKPVMKGGELPAIATKIKNFKTHEGLFKIHVKDENCLWELNQKDLAREYFWSCVRTTGVGERLMTGGMGPLRPITFRRHGNTLLVEQPITEFYADPESAQHLGLEKNFKPSVIARLPIIAGKGKRLLVDGTKLLKSFSFQAISGVQSPGEYSRVKEGTRFSNFKIYPTNFGADIEVDLQGKNPKSLRNTPLADNRNLTVGLHFDLIEHVKTDYTSRRASEKVGYFAVTRRDLTDPESRSPNNTLIRRWNLKKKDPTKAVSDVVKPITFWLSNNTPYEYREIIRDGVLEWNKAFEAAGLRNAVACKFQPADADWDIGDFRYNVIQWMTSNRNFFLGHGPVKSNPYTGEILRAHIRLEGESFHSLGTVARMIENRNPRGDGCEQCCDMSPLATEAAVFGDIVEMTSDGALKKEEVIHQLIKKVTIHEVGHTLGLRHNFRSNLMTPADKVHDKAFAEANGLTGSIMDYVKTNLHPDPKKQGYFYSPTVGTYDVWAIRYGYTPAAPEDEEKVLNSILAKPLPYSTDEDTGQDPWAHRFVHGADPIGYEADYRKAIDRALSTLKPGSPMSEIPGRQRKMFAYLTNRWYSAFSAMSRFLAGHSHIRADSNGTARMTWISPKIEMRALNEMLSPFKNDDKITIWQQQWDNFPPTRNGHFRNKLEGLTFDYEGFISGIHGQILGSILNPTVFNRVLEHELRGLEKGHLTQSTLLQNVHTVINSRRAESHWSRRNFEIYVDALLKMSTSSKLNSEGRHLVNAQLKFLRTSLASIKADVNDVNTAVFAGIHDKIDAHFEAVKVKVTSSSSTSKKKR